MKTKEQLQRKLTQFASRTSGAAVGFFAKPIRDISGTALISLFVAGILGVLVIAFPIGYGIAAYAKSGVLGAILTTIAAATVASIAVGVLAAAVSIAASLTALYELLVSPFQGLKKGWKLGISSFKDGRFFAPEQPGDNVQTTANNTNAPSHGQPMSTTTATSINISGLPRLLIDRVNNMLQRASDSAQTTVNNTNAPSNGQPTRATTTPSINIRNMPRWLNDRVNNMLQRIEESPQLVDFFRQVQRAQIALGQVENSQANGTVASNGTSSSTVNSITDRRNPRTSNTTSGEVMENHSAAPPVLVSIDDSPVQDVTPSTAISDTELKLPSVAANNHLFLAAETPTQPQSPVEDDAILSATFAAWESPQHAPR